MWSLHWKRNKNTMTFFKLYFLKGLLSFFLIYSFFHKVHSQIMTTVSARNHYNFLSIINFSLFFSFFKNSKWIIPYWACVFFQTDILSCSSNRRHWHIAHYDGLKMIKWSKVLVIIWYSKMSLQKIPILLIKLCFRIPEY